MSTDTDKTEKLTRTRIVVDVLSVGPYYPENLGQVHYDIVEGDVSGEWSVNRSDTLTPEAMEKALRKQGSDADFLLDEHYANHEPRMRVEYDPAFFGGDYHGTGQFALVPVGLVDEHGGVEKAFEHYTGLPAVHIIHYTRDELYDLDGKEFEAGKKVTA